MNILIIGNGVAGVTVAETIRAEDAMSTVTMFTSEKYPFYSRPRLIELLAGTSGLDKITIHGLPWYEKNNLRLCTETAIEKIDSENKIVRDGKGATYPYDALVIATGALCEVPPIPGADLPNVFTIRTVDDTEKVAARAAAAKKAVVIGGGLLGIEVANSLRMLGNEVVIVEMFDRLLPRQLDRDGATVLQYALEKTGLVFYTGVVTRSIVTENDRCLLTLDNGAELEADYIVISAGIRPNLDLLAVTTFHCNKGVVVDKHMKTSVSGVYAAGDVAEVNGQIYGLWQAAREQAVVCGKQILGHDSSYVETVVSTRLKVAGIDVASIGEIHGGTGIEEHVEKDEQAGTYKKTFTAGARLIGAILVGNVKEAVKLQLLIKNG